MRTAILTWLSILGYLVLGSHCQARADWSEGDVMTCTRAAIGEVGWRNLDAAIAVTATHARRAELMGVSPGRACQLYSAALQTCSRPWVCYLDTGRKPPPYWPRALRWPWHRERVRLISEVIRWHVAGLWPDPCEADHYGGPMDAPRNGWRLLRCVIGTRQRFYSNGA